MAGGFIPGGRGLEGGAADSVIEESRKRRSPYPTKKKKWEDDYRRATFYIQNDVFDELDYRAGAEKGEKTKIINEALQLYFKKNPIK